MKFTLNLLAGGGGFIIDCGACQHKGFAAGCKNVYSDCVLRSLPKQVFFPTKNFFDIQLCEDTLRKGQDFYD